MNGLAAHIADLNPACSYIITTFDSGGSSANLRDVFDMPAVGDVRNRLIALADTSSPERANIVKMLSTRLPKVADRPALQSQLSHLANGSHPLMEGLSEVVRKILADRFSFLLIWWMIILILLMPVWGISSLQQGSWLTREFLHLLSLSFPD